MLKYGDSNILDFIHAMLYFPKSSLLWFIIWLINIIACFGCYACFTVFYWRTGGYSDIGTLHLPQTWRLKITAVKWPFFNNIVLSSYIFIIIFDFSFLRMASINLINDVPFFRLFSFQISLIGLMCFILP